jgi:hypothetical protein
LQLHFELHINHHLDRRRPHYNLETTSIGQRIYEKSEIEACSMLALASDLLHPKVNAILGFTTTVISRVTTANKTHSKISHPNLERDLKASATTNAPQIPKVRSNNSQPI